MLNSFVRSRARGVVLGLVCIFIFALHSAVAQVTALDRQLDRVDVAVGGSAVFTAGVSGNNYLADSVTLNASTTVGALVQVRYTKSNYVGFEGTYSYARFNESYICASCPGTTFPMSPFGVQTDASEYTLGYVAHLPTFLGFQPFASGGAGSIAFKPTPLGGQGLPERARFAYYYDIGVEDQLTRFFGVRAQFRQIHYKAPDFGQNYLGLGQGTLTTEPTVGFYVKF